jgi:HSP20 family protein
MVYEIVNWTPFREVIPFRDFEGMRKEMDRLWGSLFEGGLKRGGNGEVQWIPSLDLSETKSDLVVNAELPGIDPKDVDISLNDGLLTIQGERKQEKEEKGEDFHHIERTYGSFSRSVRLPKEVKQDKINASFKNGVLKIVLPKSEEAKKKEIKIKVE